MKLYKKVLAVLGIIALMALSVVGSEQSALTEQQRLSLITQCTSKILSKAHYRQHEFDNYISSKLFDEYFKLLDPVKIYFTKADIAQFEVYRNYLDDLAQIGNNKFAMAVYKLFLKRMQMYRDFAAEQLKKGFDFSKKESFALNRDKLPRAANLAELKEIWRKKLKNEVLYLRLMKKVADEAKKAEKKSADNKKKEKKISPTWLHKTPREKIMARLDDNLHAMQQNDNIDILGIYLTALAQVYGPHSSYMPPKSEEDFNIDMKLSLVGIGAVLTTDAGYTKIVKLIPGGPAQKEGTLRANDRIIAVAQEGEPPVDIVDMSISRVVKLIRGKKGTKVTLTILPFDKGVNAIPVNVTIVRDKVILKESEAQSSIKTMPMPDGSKVKIGIIRLEKFYIDFEAYYKGDPNYMSASRDVKKILKKFNKEGVDGVIIDLRNNGGGSLMEAINLTGLFIKSGPIVQVRRSNGQLSIKYDPDPEIVCSKPLMLLTNKLTASAAEIFTGAIKDYRRGIVIGDSRTYGKGTVLDVFPLKLYLKYIGPVFPAGSVKYESGMYYRVDGSSTQKRGVKPDIIFPSITNVMDLGEKFNDNCLPWSKIAPVKHDIYEKNLAAMVKKLNRRHEERMAKNPKIKVLQEAIDNYRKYKKRKTISLNEQVRMAEYQKEKKIQDEQKKIFSADGDKKKEWDLCLDESLAIMRDYIWFSGPGK